MELEAHFKELDLLVRKLMFKVIINYNEGIGEEEVKKHFQKNYEITFFRKKYSVKSKK